jgi:putative transposase
VSWYRRRYTPGGTFFFTVVTQARRSLFQCPLNRQLLRTAFDTIFTRRPVDVVAWVILPDHLHAVWTLPPDDADYSTRWRRIKEEFTDAFLGMGGTEVAVSHERRHRGERGVWQRRFWEHECRDEDDLKRCLDYVHWNPVKHGCVARPAEYLWSSFRSWVEIGEYAANWGDAEVADVAGAEWE